MSKGRRGSSGKAKKHKPVWLTEFGFLSSPSQLAPGTGGPPHGGSGQEGEMVSCQPCLDSLLPGELPLGLWGPLSRRGG